MTGTLCAVAACKSTYEYGRRHGLNISFHSFPKNKKVRDCWIKACHRTDTWNPNSSTICSIHFEKNDFEVNLMGPLMNIKTKPRLKLSAIPRLFLLPPENQLPEEHTAGTFERSNETDATNCSKRSSEKESSVEEILIIVEDTNEEKPKPEPVSCPQAVVSECRLKKTLSLKNNSTRTFEEQLKALQEEHEQLKRRCQEHEETFETELKKAKKIRKLLK